MERSCIGDIFKNLRPGGGGVDLLIPTIYLEISYRDKSSKTVVFSKNSKPHFSSFRYFSDIFSIFIRYFSDIFSIFFRYLFGGIRDSFRYFSYGYFNQENNTNSNHNTNPHTIHVISNQYNTQNDFNNNNRICIKCHTRCKINNFRTIIREMKVRCKETISKINTIISSETLTK